MDDGDGHRHHKQYVRWNKYSAMGKNEYLKCPEVAAINMDCLFPFLLDEEFEAVRKGVKPSQINQALSLTTEERLQALKSPLRKYRLGKTTDIFGLCPEAVIFQNYQIGQVYSTLVSVTNRTAVTQNLNIYFESSRFFALSIEKMNGNMSRIAPGMTVHLKVSFLPTDVYRDYVHQIKLISSEFCFQIPIYGLGPRPIVYVPDKVILPPTLVKVESSSTIVLKNNGECPVDYSKIVSEPFSCNIEKAIVPPKGILEIRYSINSDKCGFITGQDKTYLDGEFCILIELECEVKNVLADLNAHIVTFEDVYIGLGVRQILTLHNSSEYSLNFAWKSSQQRDEKQETLKLIDLMEEMKEYEVKRCEKLKYFDIVDEEQHANIYERIFQDQVEELLQKSAFLYKSDYFEIIPKVGKIQPHTSFEFSVIFGPKQNTFYYSSAYLDIEGVERRVRVSLQGYGIGPPVTLSIKTLKAGQIYLTDKHQYELVVINKGVIPATVSFQPKPTDWGGNLNCIPHSLVLGPNSSKAFIVVFSSDIQGDFIETLDFIVDESGDHLQCIISGNVICPLLKCIPDALNFNTIAVGVRSCKELYLINESRVSIRYDIEFEDLTAVDEQYIDIVPRSGTVLPLSGIKIKIFLCCDVHSEWTTNLLVIMWNSRLYSKIISLSAKCACPKITCVPEVITIKFCFLDCIYDRSITLSNENHLAGFIEFVPLKESENNPIVCIPETRKLFLEAGVRIELPLQIIVKKLGPQILPLNFLMTGSGVQTLCTIKCNGQGPVVSYLPDQVCFGKIQVLTEAEQTLTLVNDSPIIAKCRVYCKNNTMFRIKDVEDELQLNPEEQMELTITACFNAPGLYKDTIMVNIYHGDVCNIKVSGEGDGTSIHCDPPLVPEFNFGTVLTFKTITKEITVHNKGVAFHKLLFTQKENIRSMKDTAVTQLRSPFTIKPYILELNPNEKAKIEIKCQSKKSTKLNEEYFCYAQIGKSVQVVLIMRFFLKAQFVDPTVTFSTYELQFRIDVKGNVAEGITEEILTLHNTTGIPMNMRISTDDEDNHFAIVQENTKKSIKDLDNVSSMAVRFTPSVGSKRKYVKQAKLIFEYESHPKTDIVNLQGAVMFPTLKWVPSKILFKCVPIGSTEQKHLVLQNISSMPAHFHCFWLEQSIEIMDLPQVQEITPKTLKVIHNTATTEFMHYIDQKKVDDNCDETERSENQLQVPSLVSRDEIGSEGNELAKMIYYGSTKYKNEMRKILGNILTPYRRRSNTQMTPSRLQIKPDNNITKWFSMEPSEGILNPYEYTIVTIGFSPPPNTQVSATAICRVEGGEEERLLVSGKSSKLSYRLDRSCVNYGNQIFCEVCTGQLTLSNNGLCGIKFSVVMEEFATMQEEMLDVSPKIGKISPGESITFKVDYFAGLPGYFNKSFTLEIGYLEPVTICVTGYAVLSQVYLCVPRLEMNLTEEESYTAVSWITPEYLQYVMQKTTEVSDEPDDPRDFLDENDWVYISYNDPYPSLMDINMAMERLAAWNLIKKNPKLLRQHTIQRKVAYIPEFFPSAYLVDFGYVIRDLPVCYTVMIYNYGPVKADVKLLEDNKTALVEKEIKIEFRNGNLQPGESTALYVIFAPTKRRCTKINQIVADKFKLCVRHGPIITVEVTATVTLPVLMLDHEELIFDQVYCGDALRRSIVLTNNGNVKSKWHATISKGTKKTEDTTFFIFPSDGELDPGEQAHLNIYFVPSNTNEVNKMLNIDIEFNNKGVFLRLIGRGLDSNLVLTPTTLQFPPVLSYSNHVMSFTVQNLTETPIEFYFPSMNSETDQEKNILQAYLKYKNLKQVFYPLIKAGSGLPEHFKETYNVLLEKLRNSLMLKQKRQLSAGSSAGIREPSRKSSDTTFEKRSIVSFQDPLGKFSFRELHDLLMDYLIEDDFDRQEFDGKTAPGTIQYRLEDSSDTIEIIEPPPKPESEEVEERKGILFVFHGAPLTDFYGAANQVSIALKIPRYSIDRLIVETIIEDETSPVAKKILETIEDAFTNLINPKTDGEFISSLEKENSKFDEIWEKIIFITSRKSSKGSKRSAPKEKSSKASSEKSNAGKNNNKQISDCFLNLNSDCLAELLRPKFKAIPQMVIESLNSVFIPRENVAFYTVLKAAGYMLSIHLVLFSETVSDFVKNECVKLQAALDAASEEKKLVTDQLPESASEPVKGDKRSSRAGSVKTTKTGSPRKGPDLNKKALQSLNKALKAELEAFERLKAELIHASQYWDKKNLTLKKPFSNPGGTKKDSPKGSAKAGRNSVKKVHSSSQFLFDTSVDSGLNLWLLLNSSNNRSINYPEMIRNCLSQDTEIQEAIEKIVEDQKVKLEEFVTYFSVLSKPPRRKNEISDTFCIRDYIEPNQSLTGLAFKGRSKSGSSLLAKAKKKRSSKASRKSEQIIKTTREASTVSSYSFDFTPKMILMPGNTAQYLVKFNPKKRGIFSYTYTLESFKNKRAYSVKCQAVCELPKLDTAPETMFPRVLETYREKAAYDHYIYIRDKRTFDFGTIIAGSSPDKCLLYSTSIVLRNASSTTCEVKASLSNDIFCIEPTNFTIAPEREDYLRISVKSSKTGNFIAKMYISIKDNPEVEEYSLTCSACKMEFSIYPKTVYFEKVPVSFSAKRSVRLTNSTSINLRWEFVDSSWIKEVFNICYDSGHVPLYSITDIAFRFNPTEEMTFPKRNIPIRVYDVNSTTIEPCFVDNIVIHADSVEYNLDLDDHIDYGDIKGGVEYKNHFSIFNRGKCDIALNTELIINPLEEQNFVREYFRIQPTVLVIGAQKTELLNIVFHPKSNFSVSRLLLFVVNMLESFQSGHIVKTYKVFISATSFMPSYKLCPQSAVNFGHVPLSESKQLRLELSNRGKFPFNFSIINYGKLLESGSKKGGKGSEGSGKKKPKSADKNDLSEKNAKGSAKKGKPDKGTKTKSETSKATSKTDKKKPTKATRLDLGRFSLVPASGTVEPGHSFITDIEFRPNELKDYKEEILINILEIEDISQKKIITLKGIGCEAKINLFDVDNVFTEQYLVTKIDDFVLPKNVDGVCVFSSSEFCLYFMLVCINTSFTTRLYFKNIGFVTSQITTKTDDGNKHFFSSPSSTTVIEPHSTNYVEVSFSPKTLEVVNGTLEISYNASKDNKLIIQLHGQACVPQIKLLNPKADENDVAHLDFGPVCVGYSKQDQIAFKNVGLIKCKVIAEVSRPDVVALVPTSDTKKMLNLQEEDYNTAHIMVNLLLDDIAHFHIIYKPKIEESCQTLLSLHTIRNPYEMFKIQISGLSYDNNVIIENLEAVQVQSSQVKLSNTSLVSKSPIGYLLNMGFRQLNRLSKISFIIRNRSKSDIYKFRFYCHTVTFIPELGHLKPNSFKEVLVVFRTSTPIIVDREEITCTINKIEYTNPDKKALSWDDRQKLTYYVESYENSSDSLEASTKYSNTDNRSKSMDFSSAIPITKAIIEGSEPEHTTDIKSQIIVPIYLSIMADYCKYYCETNTIQLADTYVNEESFESFNLENRGTVPLTVTWTIINKNSIIPLKRSNSAKLSPSIYLSDFVTFKSSSSLSLMSHGSNDAQESYSAITIDPEIDTIRPGEQKTFSIHFRPETHGMFEGIIKSSIPELDPRFQELEIDIRAQALPIQFYFQLENGVSTNKNVNLTFQNVGVSTESIRRLLLVNTSEKQVNFKIVAKERKEFSYFICDSPKGHINKSKKCVVSFTFRPPVFGTFKEEYCLHIPETNINKLIFLEGVCQEPKVYFTETNIPMKPTVQKVKTSRTINLRNDEDSHISFKFIKKSLYSESQQEKLDVFPIVGRLKPHSNNEIKLSFTSKNIVTTNFHVRCLIEKLKLPLSLHVSACCLKIEPIVSLIDKTGVKVTLFEDKVNIVDLGYTYKGRTDPIRFDISNRGKTGMFYTWEFDLKPVAHLFHISVDPEKHFLKSGENIVTYLKVIPLRNGQLKQFRIALNIMYGPTYTIHLNAIADKPSYSFSFNSYDFGYCMTQTGETNYYNTTLIFKNLDNKVNLLENLFEKTEYLNVDFGSSAVPPGESRNIPIQFYPQKEGHYKTDIVLLVGGIRELIPIKGQAVNVKIELCNPKDKFINFGEVLTHTVKKYRLGVINNSPAKIEVHFDIYDNLIIHTRKVEKIPKPSIKMPVLPPPPPKESKKGKGEKGQKPTDEKKKSEKLKPDKKSDRPNQQMKTLKEKQEEERIATELALKQKIEERQQFLKCFTIVPNIFVDLPPRGKSFIDVMFSPNRKMDFEEKIYFEIQDYVEPLCVIKGSSVSPEFILDKNELLFFGVISGCTTSQIISLKNIGDVMGRTLFYF
ncbi:hydrocephalus-inducing protein homolog isoform X2 [Anthonomus grandis grandis]|uniref:hydrocephalus-inducing protein homolog isoform X2 n=1 Tax=Anthonomus grandis grandis TaxID=2921223 RepID=UPI0021668702|nr:hydrocephalus-inducing protein homolog isoform X2 [Anthonomus grandis grandis]